MEDVAHTFGHRDVRNEKIEGVRACLPLAKVQYNQLYELTYQDSDLITQSELKGIMNDNSEDGKIQDWYLCSYIPTMSMHRPRHV